jgi:DNA repair protein RecN (Recombination protein N)
MRYDAEELARELRGYLHDAIGIGDDTAPQSPARLVEVEERLALFARLERKHGGSIADVLAYAERCRERHAELDGAEVALEGAEISLAAALSELERLAEELHAARSAAAPELAVAVRAGLDELAMSDARFEVELSERAGGIGPRGLDAVELLIAPNAGVPVGPLREIASGGELSRVMLALLSVAHSASAQAGEQQLLVFDEVDAGIGGHTARAVGEHLRALADSRQILCITHLPQVASLAAKHFRIFKQAGGELARTVVQPLAGENVVAELVRMLGADEGDRAARGHARELLKAA